MTADQESKSSAHKTKSSRWLYQRLSAEISGKLFSVFIRGHFPFRRIILSERALDLQAGTRL
jgi:hypothetical protein